MWSRRPVHVVRSGAASRASTSLSDRKGHELVRAALPRNREHASDHRRLLGMIQGGVAEQRMNGGQACVAGAHGVGAVMFEMSQEAPDEGRIDVVDLQLRGRFGEVVGGEADEQSPRVAVCGDGVRAGVSLLNQPGR